MWKKNAISGDKFKLNQYTYLQTGQSIIFKIEIGPIQMSKSFPDQMEKKG